MDRFERLNKNEEKQESGGLSMEELTEVSRIKESAGEFENLSEGSNLDTRLSSMREEQKSMLRQRLDDLKRHLKALGRAVKEGAVETAQTVLIAGEIGLGAIQTAANKVSAALEKHGHESAG